MAELARGSIADRPWGRTLGTLGLRGLTGQLTLTSDGKRFQIAFSGGAVISATSPLASDAAARIAMTSGLMSSTQVSDIARRQAATPGRDEIDVIAELVKLTPDQALRLRRRVVAQRAARTFSIERGDFIVEDRVTVPFVVGTEMDIRGVIYLGARQNLSELRLATELATFGHAFRLKPEAVEDLPQFGFTTTEQPVLERLQHGASLGELERTGVDTRVVRAAVYALAACAALEIEGARPSPASLRSRALVRAATPRPDTIEPPTTHRRREPTSRAPTTLRRRTDSAQAATVRALIDARGAMLSRDCNYFELLGVSPEVTPEELRAAYFKLARQLHPDRLTAVGILDEDRRAQALFAEVNTAFAVLSDPKRRYEYTELVKRGGAAAVAAEQAQAEEMAARIVAAEEAFRRGEAALRRDQLTLAASEFAKAMQLHPEEADYAALHAWAQFCASPDKMALAAPTRASLERAIEQSPRAVTARFYLGRVERMLGRDHEALRHFKDVLTRSPGHTEASSEVRVIEARLAAGSGDKDKDGGKGLFGRLKR